MAVLVVGVGAVWWWLRPARVDVSLPGDVGDPEVRAALEDHRRQVEGDPRSADAWGRFGMTLQANGYRAEADRFFAEAQRLAPEDGRWPYFRALAALGEDAEVALPFLRQAAAGRLPGEGEESAVRLRLAEALLERQELAGAEELFQREWQLHPGDPRAAFGLGLIARARDQREAAEKYLRVARSSPTVRKPATAQLAALARVRGDLRRAGELEQEFSALPDEAPVWSDPLLGQLLRRRVGTGASAQTVLQLEAQHRYADAARAYSQLIEHHPTAQNYVGAGLNAVRSGQTDRGLKLLREAVRIDTQRADSHFALAQGLFQVAVTQHARAADSREVRERFLEVAETARRATDLKPDNAHAFLLWGQSLMYRGEWSAAIAPLRSGVAVRPEVFDLQLSLGEALLESGQLRDAETHLNNARKLDPKDERATRVLQRLQQKRP
jgi:tetratricopeptide (TPR) repeat protein